MAPAPRRGAASRNLSNVMLIVSAQNNASEVLVMRNDERQLGLE